MYKNFVLAVSILFILGCGSQKQAEENKSPEGQVYAPQAAQAAVEKKDYMAEGLKSLTKEDVKTAIQDFDLAIRQDPTNSKNYIMLGQVYMHLNNFKSAADTFTASLRVDPNNGDIFYLLAVCQRINGDRGGALISIQKSSEIFMKNKEQDKLKKALTLLKTWMEEKPDANTDSKVSSTKI